MTIRKIRARIRAKRHANSKLLRALVDRKTHHAVETDGGQNEGDYAENREQSRDDAIAGKNFVVQSRRRAGEIDRQIRIELGDRFAQRGSERFRALSGARPNDESCKIASPATRRAAACRSRRCRSADRTVPASTCRARRRRWCATAAAWPGLKMRT